MLGLRTVGVKMDKSLDLFDRERFFPQNILDFIDKNGTKTDWLHSYAKNPVLKVFF